MKASGCEGGFAAKAAPAAPAADVIHSDDIMRWSIATQPRRTAIT